MAERDLLDRLEKATQRFCAECGAEFFKHAKVSRARFARQNYCSQGCAGKAANHRKIKTPDEMSAELLARSAATDAGCLEYQGGISSHGYALIMWRGEQWTGHRLAWYLRNGEIPAAAHVCHRCDNRRCVNADHLFLGDNAINIADRDSKGRQARGERSGRAKLSNADVLAIRASTDTNKALAADFGVAPNTISEIRAGRKRVNG